jgi:hypothetical protein
MQDTIPYGYCQCGCNQKTERRDGKQRRYVNGHKFSNRRIGEHTHLTCSVCQRLLPVDRFTKRMTRQTYRGSCKECDTKGRRKRLYGLTIEDFERLVEEQNHCCSICKQFLKSSKELHVDHDHQTGAVRGLLCKHCNQGLGHFRDSELYLESALDYLRRSRT